MNCDPNSLMEAARCFKCIPRGELVAVQSYLVCQWANNAAPSCPVSWSPASETVQVNGGPLLNLAEFCALDLATVTSMNFTNKPITALTGLISVPNLDELIIDNTNLTALTAAGCANITTATVQNNASLVTLDMSGQPLLDVFNFMNNPSLQTFDASGDLTMEFTVGGGLNLTAANGFGSLLSVDISNCLSIGIFAADNNLSLTTVVVTGLNAGPITSFSVAQCALTLADLPSSLFNNLFTLIIDNCPVAGFLNLFPAFTLGFLSATNCQLTSIKVDVGAIWTYADVSFNAITVQADIDNLFCDVDTSAQLNGTQFGFISTKFGTSSAPGAAGIACQNDLIGAFWTALSN